MKNIIKKAGIVFVSILAISLLLGFGYVYDKLNSIYVEDKVESETNNKQDGDNGKIANDDNEIIEGVTNILLVGTDGRSIDKGNRSDSIMLVTINTISKGIKITSIARDTYVDIPGYSAEKIAHAYAYGGIDLLKEVFKVNFNINIDKYIAVNFVSFMDIMDEIGGVVVNIEQKDIDEVNKYIDECYEYYYNKKDSISKVYITKSGQQRLNGYQALAFSRIRYTDSAYARDNRHREVAQNVYDEILEKDFKSYEKIVEILLNNTKTNINPIEMMDLGYTVLSLKDKNIEQLQFPLEEYRKGHIINDQKGWVIEWDKEPNLEAWHTFIIE